MLELDGGFRMVPGKEDEGIRSGRGTGTERDKE
jgi:hypothetical protein